MKQHINLEQFEKLPDNSKSKLLTWALDREYVVRLPNGIDDLLGKHYYVPLLNIGQMIEFLDEHIVKNKYGFDSWMDLLFHYTTDDDGLHKSYKGELCDALWEAVKEVLSK